MHDQSREQNDFVRVEIEAALAQRKLVIPVLVMNAKMPDFSTLPHSIQELQWLQSATIRRPPDLEVDCERLVSTIEHHLEALTASALKKSSTELLPQPFDWIDIPGSIGKTWNFAPYRISKYPVTNSQFRLFVEAKGYYEKGWWTEKSWHCAEKYGWRMPRYWNDPRWNGHNQPVVGISIYEAIAFCTWLSEASGEVVTLPTELQWQYAAQGDDQRSFPWGNHWLDGACRSRVGIFDIFLVHNTTSVLYYEARGASPFGVIDMAGNIYEWCLRANQIGEHSLDEDEYCHTKGGSWMFNRTGGSWMFNRTYDFRCDNSFSLYARNRDNSTGFRLASSTG